MAAKRRVTSVSPAATTRRERRFRAESAWRLLPRKPTILGQLPTKSPKYLRNTANWLEKQVCALSGGQSMSLQVVETRKLKAMTERAMNEVQRCETVRAVSDFQFEVAITCVSLELPGNRPVSLRFLKISQVETISGLETVNRKLA